MRHSIGFPVFTILIFVATVVATVYFDLVRHRPDRQIALPEAIRWSLVYVGVSLAFAGVLLILHGREAAVLFLTGYLLEKTLSVDNLIVFCSVFAYFNMQPRHHRRILYYGVVGAVAFRLVFVFFGAGSLWLLGRPVEFLFGLMVAWSAWTMLRGSPADRIEDYDGHWYIRWTRKLFPKWGDFLLCMVAIECTDVMFSFDSVPTVIAVTRDPTLVYTAMIFAILGLRSLYFVLAALRRYLVHLDKAVAALLAFIGTKLVLHAVAGLEVSAGISLGVVFLALLTGAIASVLRRESPVTDHALKETT